MLNRLKKPLYSNCVILSPNGQILCRAGERRMNWYLDKGLAVKIADSPPTIKLTFEPAGAGDSEDPYMISDRKNICVVCGATENLTRHHIVPHCYKIHFPIKMKGHTSYDILPVCIDCHEKYEEKARDYRKNIIKELKILDEREDSPPIGKPDIIKIKGIKAASALSRHQNKMPIDRKQKLFNDLSLFLNKDINQITPEDIEQTIELSWKMFPDVSYSSSQKVVEKLTDIDDFARRWRLHFLEMTKPKHLPPHWIADKKLYNKNLDN